MTTPPPAPSDPAAFDPLSGRPVNTPPSVDSPEAPPPLLPPNPLSAARRVSSPPPLNQGNLEAFHRRNRRLAKFRTVIYLLFALVLAVLITFLYRVGFGGFYVTDGHVELGPLHNIAAGPVEVYLVPQVPDGLVNQINTQLNDYFNAVDTALHPGVAPLIPNAPTILGGRLLAQMPVPMYGVSNPARTQWVVNPLPVAPQFLQPGNPARLYFMEPLGYLRYRNAIAFLTPAEYPEELFDLRAQATTDLALLEQEIQNTPPDTDTYLLAQLDRAWLVKFLAFLNQLPPKSTNILVPADTTLAESGPAPISFFPVNLDAQLAAVAIGSGPLAADGSFHIQGRGTPVLRIPIAGGGTLYFVSPAPLRDISISGLDSRLNLDPNYIYAHLVPTQPALPPPSAPF